MKDAPRARRPSEASAPVTKARVLIAYGRAKLPTASSLLRRVEFPLRAPTTPLTVTPLKPIKHTGIDYDTDWARKPLARATRRVIQSGVIRPLAVAWADPQVEGLDRLEHIDGPVIFAANHHSHLDTPILLSSLPSRFRNKSFVAGAADYFFTNRIAGGSSALALNAIPIERSKVSRRSSDLARELLDDGWSMVIFPEGGRSPDGWGQPFKGGAAYLAVKCDVPVVPVHVWGTDRLLPKGSTRPHTGSTLVTFGRPLVATEGEDSRRFGPRIESAVAALADEATSDWWTARQRAYAGATPALGGPDTGSWRRSWMLGSRDPHHRGRRPKAERQWP